jgi:hypothetical protein
MNNNESKIIIAGVDYISGVSGVDYLTETLQTISYEHHEIHNGVHYIVSDVADLSVNNVLDIQLITPNTTKWTHITFQLDCESETEWYIYEGVTIINAGDTITPYNNNRNSNNLSGNILYKQSNTSITNANLDTNITGAIQLEHGVVGTGKKSLGTDSRDKELVLKQNTAYCFRGIANTAGYLDFLMSWYEHENKN